MFGWIVVDWFVKGSLVEDWLTTKKKHNQTRSTIEQALQFAINQSFNQSGFTVCFTVN